MATAAQDDVSATCSSLPLRGFFDINKTSCDVELHQDCISWSAIQPTGRNAKCGNTNQSLYLREVFAVRINRITKKNTINGRRFGVCLGITLFTCKPKRGSCVLQLGSVTLHSKDLVTCEDWAKAIGQIIEGYPDRPKRLHIFIDTRCENGNAMQIFHKKVQPLLQLAKITFEIVDSSEPGHMRQILQTMSYEGIDGIVCIGDDKIVNEISNGLLLRTQSDAQLSIKLDHTHLAKCCMPLGIIPVGPFNMVAHSSQGANDPVTSILHIIYGHTHPIDVCTLFQDDALVRFGFSAMYGFGGDCLRRAEKKKKLLGKRRAEYAVARSVLKLRPYECEISFLPSSSDVDGCIPDRTPCQSGCSVCQTGKHINSSTPTWSANTLAGFKKGPGLASFLRLSHVTDAGDASPDNSSVSSYSSTDGGQDTPQLYQSSENLTKQTSSSRDSRTQGLTSDCESGQPTVVAKKRDTKHPGIGNHFVKLQQRVQGIAVLPEGFTENNDDSEWRTVDGTFFNVSLMTLPNLCSLCPGGMSPQTHLADGSADLILARTTTKAEFVQHLGRYALEKDQFDLPFISIRRIKAVRIVPKMQSDSIHAPSVTQQSMMNVMSNESKQDQEDGGNTEHLSVWNIDMEMFPPVPLEIRVHKQLLTIYGTGVAYVDKSPAVCGCL